MSLEPIDTDATAWRRVSRKYIVVDVVSYTISGVILTGISVIPGLIFQWSFGWAIPVVVGLISLVVIALTPRRVRAIGYALREDDLVFRRGIMWTRVVAVPYGRMQLVDITRGPVARLLGLADLKFVTAAATSGVAIPGLAEADADALRDRLVELAESRRAGL